MLVTKQLTVAIVFHSIFFHTVDVNGYRQLCSTEETRTVFEQLEGSNNWWQNAHFWGKKLYVGEEHSE